jgi:hypothetical protein
LQQIKEAGEVIEKRASDQLSINGSLTIDKVFMKTTVQMIADVQSIH